MPIREIYRDEHTLAKIYPPAVRTLAYGYSRKNLKTVRVSFPETIFIVSRPHGLLYVGVRPLIREPYQTDFYETNLPNRMGGGTYCLGAQIRGEKSLDDFFQKAVDRFLTSRFSSEPPKEIVCGGVIRISKILSFLSQQEIQFDGENVTVRQQALF